MLDPEGLIKNEVTTVREWVSHQIDRARLQGKLEILELELATNKLVGSRIQSQIDEIQATLSQ